MMQLPYDWKKVAQATGLEHMLQPVNSYADWWWDCAAWSMLNLWYLPHQTPAMYSDLDQWISQFSLNGAKSNICRPN
jgi:hypothetical protein